MDIHAIIDKLDESEKMMYIDSSASSYFRATYYSKRFSSIVSKLDTSEKLTNEEWEYLIEKLYLVTYKAIMEEDSLDIGDKLFYAISKIGAKVFKNGKIHNECIKMLAFVESLDLEKDINEDLSNGLERIEKSKSKDDLSILLRQHREAVIFRDKQDEFINSYRDSRAGHMTEDEMFCMYSISRSYNREKELVKEYK